jgi:capsular polysaccharide transport system permease protein
MTTTTSEKTTRVVPLPERGTGGIALSAPSARAGARPRRRRGPLFISMLVCVVLPALLTAAYYSVVAADRYVASAGFAVRGMDAGGGGDLLGAFTGLASTGSTTSDSYILLKYLKSRDLIERLQAHVDLRAVYSRPEADFWARLGDSEDIEHLVDYWSGRIHTTFDNTAGIITFEVEAFTAQDAYDIARLALEFSKDLVNELSLKARSDAVAFADAEVDRAETRLATALEQLRLFRQHENSIDPAANAQLQLELIGGLERQLIDLRARMAALQGHVNADSPTLRTLERQAAALQTQIEERRAAMSSDSLAQGENSLTAQLSIYETLAVERDFAQKAYASALSSLEAARAEAGRQQRYIAVYSNPAIPQYPLYPRRTVNTLVLIAAFLVIWGIAALITTAVKDHLA